MITITNIKLKYMLAILRLEPLQKLFSAVGSHAHVEASHSQWHLGTPQFFALQIQEQSLVQCVVQVPDPAGQEGSATTKSHAGHESIGMVTLDVLQA